MTERRLTRLSTRYNGTLTKNMKLKPQRKTFLRDRVTVTSHGATTIAIYPHAPLPLTFYAVLPGDWLMIQLVTPLNGRSEWFVEADGVRIEDIELPPNEIKPRRRKNADPDSAA